MHLNISKNNFGVQVPFKQIRYLCPPGQDTYPSQVTVAPSRHWHSVYQPFKGGKLSKLCQRRSHKYLTLGRACDQTQDPVAESW